MGESSTQHSFIMKKSLSFPSYSASHDDQESGWTKYLDDFSQEQNEQPFALPSSSMASDAASSVGWKLNCRVRPSSSAVSPAADQRFRKSSFKKRSGGVLGDDDPLEDTASSPVNSPKVSDLQKKGKKSNGQEVASGSCSKSQVEVEGDELSLVGTDCTELKKRGLCLVPMSMLVNFLQ